jgi:hypothetical protein
MNFLLLCIQSAVCCACVYAVKRAGIISFRDFDKKDAKAWFPVSFLLVSVIYTGSKSLVSVTLLERRLCIDAGGYTATPHHPDLYDIQELDYHPYCLYLPIHDQM